MERKVRKDVKNRKKGVKGYKEWKGRCEDIKDGKEGVKGYKG